MRHILAVTFSALMLAGCADGYDKSAVANGCNRPGREISYPMMNIWSLGSVVADVPNRDLFSSNKPHGDDASANECVHKEDNKGNEPKTTDLQKIGATRPFGIKSRPV
jgi:hypothetical protein